MLRRDYIERLIEECGETLRRARELRPGSLLGPLRAMVEQLEASSAVVVAGQGERERLRLYAGLLGEEAVIHWERHDQASAHLAGRRALELFAAVSLAGASLDRADRDRVRALMPVVQVRDLDASYRDQLLRLAAVKEP